MNRKRAEIRVNHAGGYAMLHFGRRKHKLLTEADAAATLELAARLQPELRIVHHWPEAPQQAVAS